MTDIHDLRKARELWEDHLRKCQPCTHWVWIHNGVCRCLEGKALYDKLGDIIEKHPYLLAQEDK